MNHTPTYPRARLDALFDGIMAVAMTLLVLDIRLPENFHPTTSAALLDGFIELWPKFFPYLLSFYVLGSRWLLSVQTHSHTELHDSRYIRWWLFYLLLITCVPFTTIVLGKFTYLAPAVWLYLFNTTLVSIVGWRLLMLTPMLEDESRHKERTIGLLFLLGSVSACLIWSFINPSQSLWFFLLNAASPIYIRRQQLNKAK